MLPTKKNWNPYDYCIEIGMTQAEAEALARVNATKIKIDQLYENKYGTKEPEPETTPPAVPEEDTGIVPEETETLPPETSPAE